MLYNIKYKCNNGVSDKVIGQGGACYEQKDSSDFSIISFSIDRM